MKKMIVSILVMSLMFAMFATVSIASEARAAENTKKGLVPLDAQIGIWYTVWWDDAVPYNSHWTDWTRYKPVLGDYASDNEEIVRTHMSWMKQAGIDYVILDDTNGHGNDGGNIASHIDAIFDIVEAMPEGTAPKLAVSIGFGQWGANSKEAHQAEADLIYEQYAQRPVYYQWKGKPLLIDYTTRNWFYQWDDDRFTVRFATGRLSEGVNVAPETGLWGWVIDQNVANSEVMGVMPGWDTAHLGRGTTPIARNNGQNYIDLWLEALKENPETIVIPSFNDFAEETAIEAAVPRTKDTEPWAVDYYGTPTPDWYQQITQGYASLTSGFVEGFYYKEEHNDKFYKYVDGDLVKQTQLPHQQPIIVLPKGYLNGNFDAICCNAGKERENKGIVLDIFASWVDNFKGLNQDWSYTTEMDSGEKAGTLTNGAEFHDAIKMDIDVMRSQTPNLEHADYKQGFKVHPAWQNGNGWVSAKVKVQLPKKNKLYLTYYPGKVNTASDGVSLMIYVNGQQQAYQSITGEAGWKEKASIDLSAYAGETILLEFKVGWGSEALGDAATTAYDAFLIEEPLIVTLGE